MTEPTLAYDRETGDVYVTRLPESEEDLGVAVDCIKVGTLAPGLSDGEFRAAMLRIIQDLDDALE